jgi:hypothetical protein
MSDFNFKIDPANYAGIDHESYRSDMLQLALAKPTEYTKLRKIVLNIVKKEAVNSQYGIYYYLLTAGAKTNGKVQGASILADNTADLDGETIAMFVPKVPSQIVNEFALKAAKTNDKIAEEAIEMILPADWKQIADNRSFSKTKSTLGFEA